MEAYSISDSSNILSINYDEESLTMEIEFKSGRNYHYFDVPRTIVDALRQAESKGSYFNEHVKGHYRYARA